MSHLKNLLQRGYHYLIMLQNLPSYYFQPCQPARACHCLFHCQPGPFREQGFCFSNTAILPSCNCKPNLSKCPMKDFSMLQVFPGVQGLPNDPNSEYPG